MPVMKARKKAKPGTFGGVLRQRRHVLGMTQANVAKMVGCRSNYIGYLESGARHPSQKLVFRLAKALDLDQQEMFLLANPAVREVVEGVKTPKDATQAFFANKGLHTRHGIASAELKALKAIAGVGRVRTERDFLHILGAIRMALTDE